MKIWDFAYFLNIKTMGISPTLGFDTTTTPNGLQRWTYFDCIFHLTQRGKVLVKCDFKKRAMKAIFDP